MKNLCVLFSFLGFFLLINESLYAQNNSEMKEVKRIPCLFIHKIAINQKYQRIDRNPPPLYRYALIRGCAQDEDERNMATRVLSLVWNGEVEQKGLYAIEKVFLSHEEALAYAFMNHIPITSAQKGNGNELYYVPADLEEEIKLIKPEKLISGQEISLIGTLQAISKNKNGYGIRTDDRKFYYLEGIENWNLKEKFLDKRIKITGIYTEEKRMVLDNPQQKAEVAEPVITQIQLPELKKSLSLVVVFKKDIAQESTLRIMEYTDYPFWEGMDNSKGKAYFHQTGDKYHILFPSEEERQNCIAYLKNKSEIYEVYPPDWNIQKD